MDDRMYFIDDYHKYQFAEAYLTSIGYLSERVKPKLYNKHTYLRVFSTLSFKTFKTFKTIFNRYLKLYIFHVLALNLSCFSNKMLVVLNNFLSKFSDNIFQ